MEMGAHWWGYLDSPRQETRKRLAADPQQGKRTGDEVKSCFPEKSAEFTPRSNPAIKTLLVLDAGSQMDVQSEDVVIDPFAREGLQALAHLLQSQKLNP
jgi:hypothetical protein